LDGKAGAIGTDLLRGGRYDVNFVPDGESQITLPAWTGVILKIK
jgi:hypothetical protein